MDLRSEEEMSARFTLVAVGMPQCRVLLSLSASKDHFLCPKYIMLGVRSYFWFSKWAGSAAGVRRMPVVRQSRMGGKEGCNVPYVFSSVRLYVSGLYGAEPVTHVLHDHRQGVKRRLELFLSPTAAEGGTNLR